MKILQINNCHNRRGGADSVYLNTIQLLRKYGEEVVEFSQTSAANEEAEYADFFVDNFEVLQLPLHQKILKTPRQLYSFEASGKLAKLIERTRPDVAHIHLYKGVLTASILSVLKKQAIPVVITLHDYSLLCPRNILFNGDNQICEKCIKSSSINCIIHRCNRKNIFYSTVNFVEYNLNNIIYKPEKNFDKIIAVSLFSYHKHFLRKNLQNHLVHLYNFFPGINDTRVNPVKGSYFFYFGRLSLEKGLDTLIDAFGSLDATHQLKIAGTGPLEADLRNKIQANKYDNIEMLGYKSGEELINLIKNSSFVMVPSEWYENNPMTIVEGYSFGKPVIGSRVGGITELIVEGTSGFGFEMANIKDLARVIQNANSLTGESYTAMSQKARAFALEHFSAEPHYNKLIEIYKEAILNKTNK